MLAAADDIAQFWDRDANPDMAGAAMEGFQEFMVKPDREDKIRARLETPAEPRQNLQQEHSAGLPFYVGHLVVAYATSVHATWMDRVFSLTNKPRQTYPLEDLRSNVTAQG